MVVFATEMGLKLIAMLPYHTDERGNKDGYFQVRGRGRGRWW